MSEIPKVYEPQSVEAKWYAFWEQQGCFTADPARVSAARPAYSIVIPPPNVTGVLTLGHVLNNTIQDILARKARMDGKEVLWLPGTDHAGIATQNVVEKTLKKAGEIKHRDDLGREALVAKIWEWKEKYGGIILQQLRALGASCDWTRTRFTMDPEYSRCVQKVFVDLYKKGLIYRGKRMVNWCPASLTALSDEEVVMKEQKGFMYHFKVEVVESIPARSSGHESAPISDQSRLTSAATGEQNQANGPVTDAEGRTWLTIATTRPETIPADTAVAVNPKDPRYQHLIGKHVYRALPLDVPKEQRIIPIIADEHVDFEFGTGVLKVTPAHDQADFEIGLRHKLPVMDVLTPDGKMTAEAGADLAGLDRFIARKKAAELLEAAGALEKAEPYVNKVGFSERADVPIEPRLSEQWFLKYPSVEAARRCVIQPDEAERLVAVIPVDARLIRGGSMRELRRSAMAWARQHGILGRAIRNEDSGLEIRIGRQSLTHAFGNRGAANVKVVAALPALIAGAVHLGSEDHQPPSPQFRRIHRFVAAFELEGGLHRLMVVAKELWDGTILYDHKAKKMASGGQSLEAHRPKAKLDTQPAPNATVTLSLLLEGVKPAPRMRFFPDRWAKVYDHWMGGIQDWCISRQLWWGHRIPVWSKRVKLTEENWTIELLFWGWDSFVSGNWEAHARENPNEATYVRVFRVSDGKELDPQEDPLMPVVPETEGEYDIFIATLSPGLIECFERNGFTQDPDVLDTWFSSWLWPFATMGWTGDQDTDAQNPTLKAFYPTTDLVTGPDIIFFWVARMIMAGHEYMGELPFRNVYFTGIIRDKQGRKMSKSLGNSPDPLDLIAKYGADALRFGVMRAAPLGQDVLFDEQAVELGRNFCNKLWNACRFRQMQGGETEAELDPARLTSDDKWILLRLDRAIREVTAAFAEYKFSDATATLYRFFWSEFCDWYLECSKAALGSPDHARKQARLAVLDFVLGHTLRLFHPFLPFITEELWHGLGYSADLPADQGGRTIMTARWPQPLDANFKDFYGLDDCYEEAVEAKFELVRQGRNLRRLFNLPSAQKLHFILRPAQGVSPHEAEYLKALLNAETLTVDADYAPPQGTPQAGNAVGTLYLPLAGLIDPAAERARLGKELEKIRAEVAKVQEKLANPNFTQKVPPVVLAEHQQRLADWQAKAAQVEEALASLAL